MTPTIRTVAALIAVTCAGVLAACGVPAEDTARDIEATPRSAIASATPATAESGPATEKLFLVRNGTLVTVTRQLPSEASTQSLVEDLLAGPTSAERDDGITSALLGYTTIPTVEVRDRVATVELGASTTDTGRNDDVLAFGQFVCTLAERPDIDRVAFTHDGQPLRVPRGDASLTLQPLTPADYANLVTN